jgi:serine/threonine-protein kinase
VGRTFGAYKVFGVLGAGGFGTVYEAEHPALKGRVALKVMHPSLVSRNDLVQRFRAEARFAAGVRHPNVVQIADLGEERGVPYVTMELLRGMTLDAMLVSERKLSVVAAVDMLLPVLSAVAAMHARGVIHRDLKPENIFLSSAPDGSISPKVLDFGVAAHLDARGSVSGELVGSPSFMSPEATRSLPVDTRSDVFSLGAVLYEALTGVAAFSGNDFNAIIEAVRAARVTAPRSLRAELPPSLEAAVMMALAAKPAQRFASTVDMGHALVPYASPLARRAWQKRHGVPTASGMSRTITSPPPALGSTQPASSPPPPRVVPGAPVGEDARARVRLVPRFAELTKADIDALLMCVRWRRLLPGEVLYEENAPGESMAFIVEGAVKVFSQGQHERHEIGVRGVGSFLGEMTCLDPAPRSATVIASVPSLIGEISRDHFRALRQAVPSVASAIMREVIATMNTLLREVDEQIDRAFIKTLPPPSGDAPGTSRPPPRTHDAPDTPAPTGMDRLIAWFRGIR